LPEVGRKPCRNDRQRSRDTDNITFPGIRLNRTGTAPNGANWLKNPGAGDKITLYREGDVDDDVDDLGDSDFSGDSDLDEEGLDDDRLDDDFTLAG